MVSLKLELHNFVDVMPRMLPHNVDTNIYKGSSVFQIDFNLNMLIREYNLTINNNNQKLFISVQTENNKNKI